MEKKFGRLVLECDHASWVICWGGGEEARCEAALSDHSVVCILLNVLIQMSYMQNGLVLETASVLIISKSY